MGRNGVGDDHIKLNGTIIKLIPEFLTEMMETREQCNNILKCWGKNCHSDSLYPVEIPF